MCVWSASLGLPARRQRSEQYLTWSQSRSHFLRQVKGSEQYVHCLVGRSDFFRIFTWAIVCRKQNASSTGGASLPDLPEPGHPRAAVKICDSLPIPICRGKKILAFLITAAVRTPKLTLAVALLMLAALASTLTYTGFLVVGVLAEHLGTNRAVVGLLLGGLFARFPWISKGRLRIVGLVPKPARRPLMLGILAFCLLNFLWRGEQVAALFTALTTAFLLTYPWLRRTLFDRMSSFFGFTGFNAPKSADATVIEGEFREKKE